jgi:DNA-binding GntR family transcriptional regulator
MPAKRTKRSLLRTGQRDSAIDLPVRSLLKEEAYSKIKRGILAGQFPPGSFVAERQLAAGLGMSKTPVRAALERLEAEGFVAISPQQGIIIRDSPIHEVIDNYEIRAALETYVVRTVAGRLTPEQVERLRANLKSQEATIAPSDVPRAVALDAEYHILFCEFLGNQEILRVMSQLREKIQRVITNVFQVNAARIASSYQEHRTIAEAVLSGDAVMAVQRMEEHLEYGKRHLLSKG